MIWLINLLELTNGLSISNVFCVRLIEVERSNDAIVCDKIVLIFGSIFTVSSVFWSKVMTFDDSFESFDSFELSIDSFNSILIEFISFLSIIFEVISVVFISISFKGLSEWEVRFLRRLRALLVTFTSFSLSFSLAFSFSTSITISSLISKFSFSFNTFDIPRVLWQDSKSIVDTLTSIYERFNGQRGFERKSSSYRFDWIRSFRTIGVEVNVRLSEDLF